MYYVYMRFADGEWYNIYCETFERCADFVRKYKMKNPNAELEIDGNAPLGRSI